MASVQDLYLIALDLQAQQLGPYEVSERVADAARTIGMVPVIVAMGRAIEIEFPDANRITFDGADWYLERYSG